MLPGIPPREETSLDYLIGPRDVLQVTVFQVPDLTRTVQVSGSGVVNFPLIGNVKVGGKSVDEAQQEIAAKLGKTYLRSPQVTIALVKSGQRVTVNGAVRTPQVMTLESRLTLSQAIAAAGGLSEIGNSQRVHIARASNQTVNDQIFDLEAIQAGKAADPTLVNGDIVVVEDSGGKVALKTLKDLVPFAALGALASDIRLKRDIVAVRRLPNGLQLYRYRYVWSPTLYVGVMAQEVKEVDASCCHAWQRRLFAGRLPTARIAYADLGRMDRFPPDRSELETDRRRPDYSEMCRGLWMPDLRCRY